MYVVGIAHHHRLLRLHTCVIIIERALHIVVVRLALPPPLHCNSHARALHAINRGDHMTNVAGHPQRVVANW